MLSEEENKHLEAFEYYLKTNTEKGVCYIPDYICKTILSLIEKQQKEIEELKTITNQYQAYKVYGFEKDTIAFASKKYFDNGSFREAPSIDELEDLQNQIAELKDKLDTKDKVIDKMADSMYNRPAYIKLPYMKTKEEIKEYFYKEIDNG